MNEPEDAALARTAGIDSEKLAQLRRMAALPFEERLRWLEEMDAVVRTLRAEAVTRPDVTPDRGLKG